MICKKSVEKRIQKLLNANNADKVAKINKVQWVKRVAIKEGK